MSLPLGESGAMMALILGFCFGLVLEGAGFGSPRKLVAQFTLRDFAVFKVMMTAVVVAAAGLWLLEAAGLISGGTLYVPTLFFWSIAGGGVLIGAGFALGGYCPGTSAAGLASGRIDALAFILGMVAGIGAFALLFDDLRPLYNAAQGAPRQTLDQLLGLPTPVILIALATAAAGGFLLAGRLEGRFGGPLTSKQVGDQVLPDGSGPPPGKLGIQSRS